VTESDRRCGKAVLVNLRSMPSVAEAGILCSSSGTAEEVAEKCHLLLQHRASAAKAGTFFIELWYA